MIYLREIRVENLPHAHRFPFSVAAEKIQPVLTLPAPVTIFVGENGSGKSTILEAAAAAVELPAIGGEAAVRDQTLAHARTLAAHMQLAWNRRSWRGFFLRTEDFFNFCRRMAQMAAELADDAEAYEEELSGYGLQLAKGSALGQRQALIDRYGEDLDAQSHGESILDVLLERLVPGGIYFLDEPEVAFSPHRQLALLSLVKQKAEAEQCQFVIATHSPILLAVPGAAIYDFDQSPVQQTTYSALEHVKLTRDFLNHPSSFLRHL